MEPTPTQMETFISTLATAFTGIASDALDGLISVAPVALPVLGGMTVVAIALRVFKKVAK